MRAVPAWEGVGREPLMHHRERGFYFRIAKVGIELRNLVRDELAFVDDGRRREAAKIEQLAVLKAQRGARIGDVLADDVELALECLGVGNSRASSDKDLTHRRQSPPRDVAAGALDHRYRTPSEQPLPLLAHHALHYGLGRLAPRVIERQKNLSD